MAQKDQVPNWSQLSGTLDEQLRRSADGVLGTLESLVSQARDVVGSSEAGLLVPTEDGNALRFLVSVNSSEEINRIVIEMTVPCDRSIAGFVFSSGQPIAITNPAQQSDLFNPEIDKKAGLTTQVYLALPVFHEDVPLGVLTFVNRPAGGGDEPFSALEIEWAQRFATFAAVTLRFYQRGALPLDLARSELGRAAAGVGTDFGDDLVLGEATSAGAEAPIARTLAQMEKLPTRDQEVCADLVDLLAQHLGRRETRDLDFD